MNKKLIVRKAHRYIGLLVSLQLLAWTIGGIWFSWNDIDDIHGDHLRNFDIKNEFNQTLVSPQSVFDNLSDFKSLNSLTVINILDKPVYKINYNSIDNTKKNTLIDAVSGNLNEEISQNKAIQIAKKHAGFEANIASIILITETDKHHEYREKPIPAWAITFDYPSSPTFYVSTELGTLTAVRHTAWRIFDFLWMLHTMDYEGRDNFGNWLIKTFSLIALITAISGIILFFISRRKLKSSSQ